jgi:hypothetical protein
LKQTYNLTVFLNGLAPELAVFRIRDFKLTFSSSITRVKVLGFSGKSRMLRRCYVFWAVNKGNSSANPVSRIDVNTVEVQLRIR